MAEEEATAASISTASLRTVAPSPVVAVEAAVSKQPHSPTTPLSWTTAAASSVSGSGSASGSGGCSAARDDDAVTTAAGSAMPTKRRRSGSEEIAYAAAPVVSMSSDSTAVVPPAVAVGATCRSALAPTDAARGTTTADGAAVPTPSGAAGYASISNTTRQLLGKKMTFVELKSFEQSLLHENMEMRKTFVELKSYERSLLQKNVQMQKELDIKRETQKASQEMEIQIKAQKAMVVEENRRQKTLAKSKSEPRDVRQISSSHRDEGTNSGKSQFLLFDLNMPATEEMET